MKTSFNSSLSVGEIALFRMGESFTLKSEYAIQQNFFSEVITKEWNRCLEDVIRKVLQQYLQREVTTDDFKRIEKRQSDMGNYGLFYDGVELGKVSTVQVVEQEDGRRYSVAVRFEPKKF